MTVTKEPSAKAEAKALRALVFAMAWQAATRSGDAAAYVRELRDLAYDTRSAIPMRHCDEAWPVLDEMLDDIERAAQVITPPSSA